MQASLGSKVIEEDMKETRHGKNDSRGCDERQVRY
jgi:hypothetical protein